MYDTKKCPNCSVTKPLDEFNKNKAKKDGLNHRCKTCQAAGTKAHYEKNKEIYKKRASDRAKEAREYIRKVKEDSVCSCGEDHPACLQFHHLQDKELELSKAAQAGWSIDRIKKEIDKCEIICANCHFKLHWSETYGS